MGQRQIAQSGQTVEPAGPAGGPPSKRKEPGADAGLQFGKARQKVNRAVNRSMRGVW